MRTLPSADFLVLVIYVGVVVLFGAYFARHSRTPEGFTMARGRLSSSLVGLSLFGTYLSSNTFLGVPGNAYSTNWNAFVFSLSLPIAAFVATRYFVPFYRETGEVSAYTHLERRFGRWARTYALVCYLLTQLARVGSILFGVGLAVSIFSGWSVPTIIVGMGALVTVYTLVGGIEAVIWTDAVQSIVLTIGALFVVGLLVMGMPEGPGQLFEIAAEAGKFSLGSTALDFGSSTVWVVLLYGVFINLNNFGIDQSYVQRYHAARSETEARRSVWIAAGLYIPISLVFFFIGAGLFAYYEARPELLASLVESSAGAAIGDRVFPHFITHGLPPGMAGLLVAALVAAAMSSIDTSLNSSATVIFFDIYRTSQLSQLRLTRRTQVSDREAMRVLRLATILVGAAGTGTALAMIGVQSLLSAWWTLSGIFAGGMFGLFLLGFASRKAKRPEAMIAVVLGILVILWMTLSPGLPETSMWRSPFHGQMITGRRNTHDLSRRRCRCEAST